MHEDDPLRAWYSEPHVLKAAERGAIGKLLISDELFRCVKMTFLRVSFLEISKRANKGRLNSPTRQSSFGSEAETFRQAD